MRRPVVAILGPTERRQIVASQRVREGAHLDRGADTRRDEGPRVGRHRLRRQNDGVVDTGGIGIVDVADLSEHIERQIEYAVSGANVILFVCDVRDGITALDREVAQRLRPRAEEIPVLLVVNKVDTPQLEPEIFEFCELGLGDPFR